MDRRLFLQSFSALASCSILPAQAASPSSLTTAPEAHTNVTLPSSDAALRVGVVAVGGAGNALLARYRDQLPGQPRAIALNTDAFGLARSGADVTIQVGEGFAKVRDPISSVFWASGFARNWLKHLAALICFSSSARWVAQQAAALPRWWPKSRVSKGC